MNGPLVLLHGFAGAPAAWDPVIARLEDPPPIVRPSLFGHDPDRLVADRANPPASYEDAVDRMADELRAAGVARGAHLCGYSLGGRMALGLLVRHGALFSRATLLGVHPGIEETQARGARVVDDEHWAATAERLGTAGFMAAWEAQPLFASQRRLPPAVLEPQRHLRRRLRGEGLALSLRTTGLARMPSYWPALGRIHHPIHLVVGDEDLKFRALAERARAVLPNARLSVVSGCGHNLVLEAPAEIAKLLAED